MRSSLSSHCAWELHLSRVRCLSQRHFLPQISWLNCAVEEPDKPQRVCHHCPFRDLRTKAPITWSQQLFRGGGDHQRLQCHVSAPLPASLDLPVMYQLVTATVVTQVKGPSLHDAFGVALICH